MSDYIVEPKSRIKLRSLANKLRKILCLTDVIWIPIVELLDVFAEVFEGFSYEIVPDNELPKRTHAETNIRTGHIKIKESIYERACAGKGRDRMTIAHEIAHFFMLCSCGFKLIRVDDSSRWPLYYHPEWQAKFFAGEFMISYRLTKGMKPNAIKRRCGVSSKAANYQYSHGRKGGDNYKKTNKKALH